MVGFGVHFFSHGMVVVLIKWGQIGLQIEPIIVVWSLDISDAIEST